MLTEPQMIAAFDAALRTFDLDPEKCRDSEDWWRFTLEGTPLQGGVHRADVRVQALLCKLETDVDVDALYAATRAAETPALVRFKESDCYLYAIASVPFASVTQELIERAIRECLTAANSPAAHSLTANWRSW
jgi:hypothetical protein